MSESPPPNQNRPSPEARLLNQEAVERVFETVLNDPAKFLTLALLASRPEDRLTSQDLTKKLNTIQGDNPDGRIPLEANNKVLRFCKNFFLPAKLVEKEEQADGTAFGITPLGRRFGPAVAGIVGNWQLRFPDVPLQILFGTKNQKGAPGEPTTGMVRYNTLKDLLVNGGKAPLAKLTEGTESSETQRIRRAVAQLDEQGVVTTQKRFDDSDYNKVRTQVSLNPRYAEAFMALSEQIQKLAEGNEDTINTGIAHAKRILEENPAEASQLMASSKQHAIPAQSIGDNEAWLQAIAPHVPVEGTDTRTLYDRVIAAGHNLTYNTFRKGLNKLPGVEVTNDDTRPFSRYLGYVTLKSTVDVPRPNAPEVSSQSSPSTTKNPTDQGQEARSPREEIPGEDPLTRTRRLLDSTAKLLDTEGWGDIPGVQQSLKKARIDLDEAARAMYAIASTSEQPEITQAFGAILEMLEGVEALSDITRNAVQTIQMYRDRL